MNTTAICTVCSGDKWIVDKHFPFIRRCANPSCNGIHPHDISKLQHIEGILFDADKNEFTDI